MDLYSYIASIDNTDKFIYIIIIIACIVLSKRISMQSGLSLGLVPTLMGIIASIAIIYYLNEKASKTGSNFVNSMMDKLKTKDLSKTEHLYKDSELLQFLSDIKEYKYYNPANYRYLVQVLDNFLGLVTNLEMGVRYMGETYEALLEQKTKALNTFHAFIYKIPHSQSTMKHYHEAMDRLEDLLNVHIDQTYQYVGYSYGKKPINIETKFIYKNHPRAYDSKRDMCYDYY